MNKATLADLTPDPKNANRGTVRGRGQLEQSIRQFGFLEPGVLDKNNKIVGGNKRTEVAAELGMDDPLIIESDGTRPVYVRQTHLDLDTPQGRKAAVALNRVAQTSIEFDPSVLAELNAEIDLSDLFFPDELDALIKSASVPDFQPVGEDETKRLDEKAKCICPNCGHEFTS